MLKSRALPTASAVVLIALCTLAPAHAQFTTTWSNSGVFAFPASTVTPPAIPTGNPADATTHFLTGTITYTGTQTVYTNGRSGYFVFGPGGSNPQIPGSDLFFQNRSFYSGPYEADVNAFLTNPNGIAPGATFTGNISQIYIDNTTVSGLYDRDNVGGFSKVGTFEFEYFLDTAFTQSLGTYTAPNTSIRIGAVTVPEVSSLLLALPGIALLALRRRK